MSQFSIISDKSRGEKLNPWMTFTGLLTHLILHLGTGNANVHTYLPHGPCKHTGSGLMGVIKIIL